MTTTDWQDQAACRGADDTLFYHPEGERGGPRLRRELRAKAICRECPVLMQCREQARREREPYGVWGGETEDERAAALGMTLARLHSRRSARAIKTSKKETAA